MICRLLLIHTVLLGCWKNEASLNNNAFYWVLNVVIYGGLVLLL